MATSEAESRPHGGRVLVVDEDPEQRRLVESVLSMAGYEVRAASSGAEALGVLAEGDIDVVLLDSARPELDGAGFLTRARQRPEGADLAIVFLSVAGAPASVSAALRAGADDYLVKPVGPDELLARVEVALRHKRVREQLRADNAVLEHLSRVDRLTGLYNRFHCEAELTRVRAESLRRQDTWSVMLLDLDGFKTINDSHGHRAGDEVLTVVAQSLAGLGRAGDVVGRWGGEEFVVICPSTGVAGAAAFAGRILDALRVLEVRVGDDWVSVTASIGSAQGGEESWNETLSRADAALYRAKAAGRNRLVQADEEPAPAASQTTE